MGHAVDEAGNRYGRLVVLRRNGSVRRGGKAIGATWDCQCDCGTIAKVRGDSLRRGTTKSCGCGQAETRFQPNPDSQEHFNRAYHSYKHNCAKYRGHEWKISKEQFRELARRECYYCGSPPSNVAASQHSGKTYLYNGLDRIDNTKGYVNENVVTCCRRCNRAKDTMTEKEFTEWIKQIYLKIQERKV